MKKLLVLALVANIAMAEDSLISNAKDLGKQLAEIPQTIKDVSVRVATNVKDTSKKVVAKVKDTSKEVLNKAKDVAQTVKNSETGQDIADVAGQFAAFPVQVYDDATDTIKDGFNVIANGSKTLGKKIAGSRFAAKVKDANQAIVDGTKKAVTKVKDFADDVTKTEAYGDVQEFFGQIGDGAKDAWRSFAALFKASKEKIA